MPRIFPPLSPIHPLVADQVRCWICDRSFQAGQRTLLVPSETVAMAGSLTCEAKVVHATCRLRGLPVTWWDGEKAIVLVIDRVKDGDGSPFAIVTTDDRQWKEEEVELPDLDGLAVPKRDMPRALG